MAKLDKETFRDRRGEGDFEKLPKLTADSFPTDNVLLTVATAEQVPVSEKVERAFLALTFSELPTHRWTTNKEQSDLLVRAVEAGHLPEDVDQWVGHVIPMRKVTNTNPKDGSKVRKLYPYPPDLWATAVESARKALKGGKK